MSNKINQTYHLVNKGSYRALSLVFAILMILLIFFNTERFALDLGGPSPLFTLYLLWGTTVLWVHGIGFNLEKWTWQLIFHPFLGYIASLFAIYFLYMR